MEYNANLQGKTVEFFPSDRTRKKFENQNKESYAAIVSDVNDNSVDLSVFGAPGNIDVTKVKHKTEAEDGRSSWDWPTEV